MVCSQWFAALVVARKPMLIYDSLMRVVSCLAYDLLLSTWLPCVVSVWPVCGPPMLLLLLTLLVINVVSRMNKLAVCIVSVLL